jgi:hypothetical protein
LATGIYGPGKWSFIAQHVPRRTDVQCRERYCNLLDPEISHGQWDEKEDQKLLEIIDKVGVGHWTDVAKMMGSRTDNQCWRRWKVLRRDDVEEYRQRILGYRTQYGTMMLDGDASKLLRGSAGAVGDGSGMMVDVTQQSALAAQANHHFQQAAQELQIMDYRNPEQYSKILDVMNEKGGDAQAAARYLTGVAAMQQRMAQAQQAVVHHHQQQQQQQHHHHQQLGAQPGLGDGSAPGGGGVGDVSQMGIGMGGAQQINPLMMSGGRAQMPVMGMMGGVPQATLSSGQYPPPGSIAHPGMHVAHQTGGGEGEHGDGAAGDASKRKRGRPKKEAGGVSVTPGGFPESGQGEGDENLFEED